MLPDFERAEVQNSNARQKYCGYGQLLDSVLLPGGTEYQ